MPSWRQGLPVSVLSPEYQRVVTVLGDGAGPLTCKELATGLGGAGALDWAVSVDSTIVRAHQHAAGPAKGGPGWRAR